MKTLSERGFTLIELMIVIAILAIIDAIAIPNLIEARKGANEAAAIGALRTLTTAQSLFREGDKDKNDVRDYAKGLGDLGKAHLVDPGLRTGEVEGYVIEMTAPADRMTWQAIACPAAANRTGGRCFAVDQTFESTTGVAVFCPPGQQHDLVSGGCVSDETSLPALAHAAVAGVNRLSSGLALPQAESFLLAPDATIQNILRKLDRNGDGRLTFDEVLNANLFAVARSVARGVGDAGISVGNHVALQTILRHYQNGVRRDLALGIASETTLPAVQISDMHGDPGAFLAQATSCPPTAEGC